MNTKHTPGPWTVGANGINSPDGHIVYFDVSGGPHETDARLIAAAPDLLAALQAWHYAYSECAGTDEQRRDAKTKAGDMTRAAITKATQP